MRLKLTISSLGLVFGLLISPSIVFSETKNTSTHTQEYKKIHAKELKSWIDSKKEFQLVDARPKKYDEGDVIPGAKFLPYDSDEKKITNTLSSKDSLVVVYCASIKCPASTTLADQLVKMGYKNVYRYPEGINDWMDKGYLTEKVK